MLPLALASDLTALASSTNTIVYSVTHTHAPWDYFVAPGQGFEENVTNKHGHNDVINDICGLNLVYYID